MTPFVNRDLPSPCHLVTHSGAGIEHPGFGRDLHDMQTDDEDDSQAPRSGALGSRGRLTATRHHDEDRNRPWRASDFPSDDAYFDDCKVKSHEDFPRHIHCLMKKFGLWYSFALTRTELARLLVSPEDLAIDDDKEADWMALYADDRDMLEDIIHSCLYNLWSPLTDTMKVFDVNGPLQPICAQKVWEVLLTVFQLDHMRMQMVLLASEIARMMQWDSDSKGAVTGSGATLCPSCGSAVPAAC